MPTATRSRKVPVKISRGPAKGRHVTINTDNLRYAVETSGLSHAQLASRAKVSTATVANLLASGSRGGKGARTTCRPETAAAIAKALAMRDSSKVFTVVWARPE